MFIRRQHLSEMHTRLLVQRGNNMPDQNNVPRISPANVQMMGESIQVVADADPELFPHGLQIMFTAPGELRPLGGGPVPVGWMVALIPPPIAKPMRSAARQAMRQQQQLAPGEVKPPGVH